MKNRMDEGYTRQKAKEGKRLEAKMLAVAVRRHCDSTRGPKDAHLLVLPAGHLHHTAFQACKQDFGHH